MSIFINFNSVDSVYILFYLWSQWIDSYLTNMGSPLGECRMLINVW